ncbi:MAG: hypothetical protein IJD98_02605 [Oscillospiraceae bacterium]|nr:hypothetical protein [Oscillospiraceae bacterium]
MRKCCLLLLMMAFLLGGCADEETFETVADELVLPVMAQPREVTVRLPDNAVVPVLENDSQQVYLSDDYEIILETLSSGDVDATVRALTGYSRDQLCVMQTRQDAADRYEFVWTCAGEDGQRLGRGVILDDGAYHYCLSVLRDAQNAKETQIVWNDVFSSFALLPA